MSDERTERVLDADAILRAYGLSEDDLAQLRERREHQALAHQMIDVGYEKYVARHPENEARARRVRDVFRRAVKRIAWQYTTSALGRPGRRQRYRRRAGGAAQPPLALTDGGAVNL